MLVMGDGDMAMDRNMGSQSSLVFLMNVVDWLSQDEGLIAIRSKNVSTRPLDEVSDGVKSFTKYLNIVGMPIVVVVIGVVRWQLHKSRKRRAL
jgi:ABC-type uncharacterized transport system involved in gliding motility auxiliary subunit